MATNLREDLWLKAYDEDAAFKKAADGVLTKAYRDTFLTEEMDD